MEIDYSKTVNLPKTEFPMKANLPVREKDIITFWEKNRIYQKIIEKNKNNKKFVLHDGPPYANGLIHIGHALNKILKDIIIKYKSMKNNYCVFIPGWDCHGLPIEYQLFKELGKNKKQIDRVEFRKKAHEFALKFVELQKKDFIRLGIWARWDNPYLTVTPEYETAILQVFGDLVRQGYIYRRKKPVYWCMNCETALADSEVEYYDISSPSIYVKFPVKELSIDLKQLFNIEHETISVLIWTTTPWTLPANVALAFNPNEEYIYAKCKMDSGGYEYLIFAIKRLNDIKDKLKINSFEILYRFTGNKLEGIKCNNPIINRNSVGILADFVSMEDGTGVVHIAPGHGTEDYLSGLKYNLPIISPIDECGKFTSEVPEYENKNVFEADLLIIDNLRNKNLLLNKSEIIHSYPHCWRCKKPIIFRATEQWFLDIEHNDLRTRMIDLIKTVKWIPSYGEIRITDMVKLRPDWCLSRQRYWGVPIPAIYCSVCKTPKLDIEIIEKFKNYVKTEGTNCWFIRPVEDFLPNGYKCDCGNTKFEKEEDILDVWFDSGTSYQSVLVNNPDLEYPADMYLEGSDQHRGWFQTSLIPSVAINNIAPYKIVLTHGFVVDGEGKKMSKSLGNVISPQEIVEKYGSEILRLWSSASDYSEDVRISKEIIDRLVETYRKIRNTIRFMLGNIYDFDPTKDKIEYEELWEIDKYILHSLQKLIEQVDLAYDTYQFHTVISKINNFCIINLSNFYFDILKDRLYTFKPNSLDRRAAQTVLFELLTTILKLISPISSFTAEESWQFLRSSIKTTISESVFLESFPVINKKYLSDELENDWLKIIMLRDNVNNAIEQKRKDKLIGSSLESKIIISCTKKTYDFLRKYQQDNFKDRLETIFIVSQVELKLDNNLSDTGELDKTDMIETEKIKQLVYKIEVVHAEGTKCQRCWNWSVNTDPNYGLCQRCKKNIK